MFQPTKYAIVLWALKYLKTKKYNSNISYGQSEISVFGVTNCKSL
jgi:hypothetical protein